MRLHHVGKVVKDLNEAVNYYKDTFGFIPTGQPIKDFIQKVEVVFIEIGFGKNPTIELIKPLSKDSPVSKFLDKGGGIHHLCFAVEDIHKAIEVFKGKKALILGNPVPGKGHNDSLTVWIYTAEKELVELVECGIK